MKADPDKLRIARRLRGETTVMLRWIAERLRMGCWTYVANNLYQRAGLIPDESIINSED